MLAECGTVEGLETGISAVSEVISLSVGCDLVDVVPVMGCDVHRRI